jgi:hypothetical protein
MKQLLASLVVVLLTALSLLSPTPALADYPKPSPYPIAWQFKFEHAAPKRVVVEIPGNAIPQAYWYMTYTVTNNTGKEQMFLPSFELMTKDGKVIRSDIGIPLRVFEAIKQREKKQFLEPYPQIAGEIRLGEEQARDGVAIWPEPMAEMGSFSIFVGGLSGEIVMLKGADGKPINNAEGRPVILRKTLQLNYFVRGDEVYPGEDQVNENPENWVMR